eukprot:PhM_4_TR3294/c0_g1_i1/m.86460
MNAFSRADDYDDSPGTRARKTIEETQTYFESLQRELDNMHSPNPDADAVRASRIERRYEKMKRRTSRSSSLDDRHDQHRGSARLSGCTIDDVVVSDISDANSNTEDGDDALLGQTQPDTQTGVAQHHHEQDASTSAMYNTTDDELEEGLAPPKNDVQRQVRRIAREYLARSSVMAAVRRARGDPIQLDSADWIKPVS